MFGLAGKNIDEDLWVGKYMDEIRGEITVKQIITGGPGNPSYSYLYSWWLPNCQMGHSSMLDMGPTFYEEKKLSEIWEITSLRSNY